MALVSWCCSVCWLLSDSVAVAAAACTSDSAYSILAWLMVVSGLYGCLWLDELGMLRWIGLGCWLVGALTSGGLNRER